VDGLPLTGINPGPGNQWLFDMENMSNMSLRQGSVAPNHFAFFTTGGVIDSQILWPKAQKGLHVAQSYGSYNFMRTYGRIDSGELPDGSAFFVSGSFTDADKWRGNGSSPNGRVNVEAAWSRPIGDKGKAKLLFSFNDAKAHNYRPLTFAQATELNTWRNYDFSPTTSATACTAVNYYYYNR
jgi:iron complex outermembrane receptor protein